MVHNIWESMRVQTMLIHNMNPYTKKKIKSPKDLFSLLWDKITNKVQSVEEQKMALRQIYEEGKKTGKQPRPRK